MEVKRTVIGSNPHARISPIPDQSQRERTITLNKLQILQIFPDRRPTAMAWINENLPRLIITDLPQKFIHWFWNELPANGWLEYDFGKKTLSVCVLEKK
jgi:hypothetical protein